jgi:hypothetical protein
VITILLSMTIFSLSLRLRTSMVTSVMVQEIVRANSVATRVAGESGFRSRRERG